MLYLADFALQKQPEHSLMVAISRAWYNGSYTMAAKPIKCLEMHYTMIQFLINRKNHIVLWRLRILLWREIGGQNEKAPLADAISPYFVCRPPTQPRQK